MPNNASFTPETTAHIDSLSLSERKSLGQYMTPNHLGVRMAKALKGLLPTHALLKVLDPAVGTGELLRAFKQVNPTNPTEYYGFDIDPGMLRIAETNIPELHTTRKSLFEGVGEHENTFDVIIGNPPYFEVKKNHPELAQLDFVTTQEAGRLNMFALFFEYSLRMLKPGGVMVFLIPPSMNNGAYFTKTREYIRSQASIEHLEIIRDSKHFVDALTSVQIIVLKKFLRPLSSQPDFSSSPGSASPFIVDFNALSVNSKLTQKLPTTPPGAITGTLDRLPVIFTDKKDMITARWDNHASLKAAGFEVKTGNIVWNQYTDVFLPGETESSSPLLYSKDIKDGELVLNPKLNSKRWLPTNVKALTAPSLIVNRIVGGLSNPKLRYTLVDKPSYYAENHVNVITYPCADRSESLQKLKELEKWFTQSKGWLPEYLQGITGNTQISATELLNLIPFVPTM